MLDNKEKYVYDEPAEYKGFKIYPIKMRDISAFNYSVGSLLLDKDSIPDINIINMTYYEFLMYISAEIEDILDKPSHKLDMLLRLCFDLDRSPSNSPILYGEYKNKLAFQIKDTIFTSNDFDEIRNIIILQNEIETSNPHMKKETREMLDKARETKAKMSGDKQCGLEDQMICLSIAANLPLDDIYNMTIRKFRRYLRRVDHKIHYEIYKAASMSGFVEFKDKNFPKHWMIDLDAEDKYEDVLVSFDSVAEKIEKT
jgi:hypothetical protein